MSRRALFAPMDVARAAAVGFAAIVGLFGGAVLSLPLYGVLAVPAALWAGFGAARLTRPWVGGTADEPVPPAVRAAVWEVLGLVALAIVAHALSAITAVGAIPGVAVAILVRFAARRRVRAVCIVAMLVLVVLALLTYPIGGLGFLIPAVCLGMAGLHHLRSGSAEDAEPE